MWVVALACLLALGWAPQFLATALVALQTSVSLLLQLAALLLFAFALCFVLLVTFELLGLWLMRLVRRVTTQ